MLAPGDRLPDVGAWREPGEWVALAELAAGGPLLLLFYLLDWTST